MRYKKIKEGPVEILKKVIGYIKKSRKRVNMPIKEIETIVKILFPKTKGNKRMSGFYKYAFVIHYGKKKLVLKIGRKIEHIRKDYETYKYLCRRLGKRKANRYFAKIYWAHGLFMLQKYGKKVHVPEKELSKLKNFGRKYGLKDIREENVRKFGNNFKIVDAERKR